MTKLVTKNKSAMWREIWSNPHRRESGKKGRRVILKKDKDKAGSWRLEKAPSIEFRERKSNKWYESLITVPHCTWWVSSWTPNCQFWKCNYDLIYIYIPSFEVLTIYSSPMHLILSLHKQVGSLYILFHGCVQRGEWDYKWELADCGYNKKVFLSEGHRLRHLLHIFFHLLGIISFLLSWSYVRSMDTNPVIRCVFSVFGIGIWVWI